MIIESGGLRESMDPIAQSLGDHFGSCLVCLGFGLQIGVLVATLM